MRTLWTGTEMAAAIALLIAPLGCDAVPDATGQVQARLAASASAHDVVRLSYKVVPTGQGCDSEAIAEAEVVVIPNALPVSVQASGGGTGHAFGDAFFTLPPGAYHVCATPMATDGPSAVCGLAEGDAVVVAGTTTEVVLVSQCKGRPSGGLDVITTLNDPPHLDKVSLTHGKFIAQCEKTSISVDASDPNGDALTYAWSIVGGPAGAVITPTGNPGVFTPAGPGDYTIQVVVTDIYAASASLTLPLHVSDGPCKVAIVGGAASFYTDFFDILVPDVTTGLEGLGLDVDFINAGADATTPTLAQLQSYTALLIFSDGGGFANATALGNVVADYVDGGGKAVVAVFANASIPIGGRFASGGYLLISPSGQAQEPNHLGRVLEPASPLMVGVHVLSADTAYRSTGGAMNGGVVVAEWANGSPLVVRGVKNGKNRVDVNFYPPSSASRPDLWSGDGFRLLANALAF